MAIERIHFEGGYPITGSFLPPDLLIQTAITTHEKVVLPEGDYNLTPKEWDPKSLKHALTVFGEGNAIYRAIPQKNVVGFVTDLTSGEVKKGVKLVKLPED